MGAAGRGGLAGRVRAAGLVQPRAERALANPDESAYLIAGRVLAGGPATDFSYSTLYQAGYPLLIAPVYWFTSNAVTV
jgi:hypothetical protein